ncbi:DUF6630 family protein [Paenibacillus bovis]|uniref:DUF6630 domain-containing protein n=1 Tax=Paenibacillus bovis TaxID=1616788 RepID=A0A172ZIP1_9BACL|nr:hypothetical protein [Paenibacillus bovis]ANF97262.1 hypothetical protein AR543_15470 [Paenibacillus bovis]
MSLQVILPFIFDHYEDVKAIIEEDPNDLYQYILDYGLATKKILYLDYRGEEGREIVNYILDYEFERGIELASEDVMEELDEMMDYAFVQDKVKVVNQRIAPAGYGLFFYPTTGDFYALFLSKLEYKEQLLQVETLDDENMPEQERYIKYYL